MFAGFIPNKQKARLDLFSELKDINTTLVFYETAPRLIDTLKAMKSVFEKREIAVARELTKIHEECISGPVDELIMHYEQVPPKGEIVVMVEPPLEDKKDVDVVFELNKRLKTMHIKDAVKEVADLSGKKKNEVYQEALRLKNE